MSDPNRTVRQSPSGRKLGALGFARLSLSAAVAFADGVLKVIPFDVVDDMSRGFGELVVAAPGSIGSFRLSESGIYMVTTSVGLSAAGTERALALALGNTAIGGLSTFGGSATALAAVGNALLVDAAVAVPGADILSAIEVIGASGTIDEATCLIVQVG